MSDWRNCSSISVVVEMAEVDDAEARVGRHRRRLQALTVRPIAVGLDDSGDAQFDAGIGLDRPERLDHDGEPLLCGDPPGVGDDGRIVGSITPAARHVAEVADRPHEPMETAIDVGHGVAEQRPHVVADDHDRVDLGE